MIPYRQFEDRYPRKDKAFAKYALVLSRFGNQKPRATMSTTGGIQGVIANIFSKLNPFSRQTTTRASSEADEARTEEETATEVDEAATEDGDYRAGAGAAARETVTDNEARDWAAYWVQNSLMARSEIDPVLNRNTVRVENIVKNVMRLYPLPSSLGTVTIYRGLCVKRKDWRTKPEFHNVDVPFTHHEEYESSWTLVPEVAFRYADEEVMAQLNHFTEQDPDYFCEMGVILKCTVPRDMVLMDISNTIDTRYTNSVLSPNYIAKHPSTAACITDPARHARVIDFIKGLDETPGSDGLSGNAMDAGIRFLFKDKLQDQFEIVLKKEVAIPNTTVVALVKQTAGSDLLDFFRKNHDDSMVRERVEQMFKERKLFCPLHDPNVPR